MISRTSFRVSFWSCWAILQVCHVFSIFGLITRICQIYGYAQFALFFFCYCWVRPIGIYLIGWQPMHIPKTFLPLVNSVLDQFFVHSCLSFKLRIWGGNSAVTVLRYGCRRWDHILFVDVMVQRLVVGSLFVAISLSAPSSILFLRLPPLSRLVDTSVMLSSHRRFVHEIWMHYFDIAIKR